MGLAENLRNRILRGDVLHLPHDLGFLDRRLTHVDRYADRADDR